MCFCGGLIILWPTTLHVAPDYHSKAIAYEDYSSLDYHALEAGSPYSQQVRR